MTHHPLYLLSSVLFIYRLKATVHRSGTFTYKLTASREVVLIASPGEDDLDESDNIVVQREWDSQMNYAIVISAVGR